MKFGVQGEISDVVTYTPYFHHYRFWGYGLLTPPILPFPIAKLCRTWTVLLTVLS